MRFSMIWVDRVRYARVINPDHEKHTPPSRAAGTGTRHDRGQAAPGRHRSMINLG
jgi:hypothetical protein